jgi:hypothetical protein
MMEYTVSCVPGRASTTGTVCFAVLSVEFVTARVAASYHDELNV